MRRFNKKDIITFKVDETLKEFMSGIDNRSEFIRKAILHTLDKQCPLCKGSGVLTPLTHQVWQRLKALVDIQVSKEGMNKETAGEHS